MKKLNFIVGIIALLFAQNIWAQPDGRRMKAIDMDPVDIVTLATAMLNYIDGDIIQEHACNTEFGDNQNVVGTIHSSEIFMIWHRNYLRQMEIALEPTLNSLGLNGLLPRWTQEDGFGDEVFPEPLRMLPFLQIDGDCHTACGTTNDLICDQTPVMTGTNDYPYGTSLDCASWASYEEWQDDVQFDYHNPGHGQLSGVMTSFKSPATPIFWLWHSQIDDVYWDYQNNCKPDGDIYIKDSEATATNDTGVEPNPNTGPMWISTDIWVRRNRDTKTGDTYLNHGSSSFANEGMHENADYRINPDDDNYVYVRIRNRSTTDVFAGGKLHVYWSKASTGLNWPDTWNDYFPDASNPTLKYGDELTPDNPEPSPGVNPVPAKQTLVLPWIEPGESWIVEVPWHVPYPFDFDEDIHHFCILARIESAFDEMDYIEGTDIYQNVKRNNNIAWKNVSVVDDPVGNIVDPGGDLDKELRKIPFTGVFVTNQNDDTQLTNLEFKALKNDNKQDFYDVRGTTYARMGKELHNLWKSAGFAGQGIKHVGWIGGRYYIRFVEPNARIQNLKLAPKTNMTIALGFAQNGRLRAGEEFDFDLCQYNGKQIVGGERYELNIVKPVNPRSTEYAENITADNFLIAPNPASDQFTVSFGLTNKEQVNLELFDINGKLMQQTGVNIYDIGNHTQTINSSNLSAGMYFLKVTSGNSVITKKVIIEKY